MKDFIRKHVEEELINLRNNKSSLKEVGQMIRNGECSASREYLVLLKRITKVQSVVSNSERELKEIYAFRYIKKMSWVAIAFKMSVSEATVKRYNRKLIETVAVSLGWI